jgi:hypothetical protein
LQHAVKEIERELEDEKKKKTHWQKEIAYSAKSSDKDHSDGDNNYLIGSDNNSDNKHKDYDALLKEAVNLGKAHQAKAKEYVPQMYEILVKKEGLTPTDAADRIYKDLVGIWQKDTIRRLLPPETKDQAARERQILSRLKMTGVNARNDAGLILRQQQQQQHSTIAAVDDDNNPVDCDYYDGKQSNTNDDPRGNDAPQNLNKNNDYYDGLILELKQENANLKREVQGLADFKKLYYSKQLTSEASQKQQQSLQQGMRQNVSKVNHYPQELEEGDLMHSDRNATGDIKEDTVLLPPCLFIKAFTLMRSYSKPIVLKVVGKEVVDLERFNEY